MTTEANLSGAPASSTAQRPASAARQLAPATARTLVAGRVLVVAGTPEQHRYPAILQSEATSLATTGLVVCGANATATVRRIRASHPDLFLLCDQTANEKFNASDKAPFPHTASSTDQDSLFAPPTLGERIQAQIGAGASLALTPTGYIQAGDRPALRAVITEANKLKRNDVIVLLPLSPKWLVGSDLKMVMAAIKRCKHPVAITLCDSGGDPMSPKGVLAGAQALAAMDTPPMFHKTDLAGFHLMAHGALAASVGVIASKRRGAIPGKGGFAQQTNRGATVLIPSLLRFRRSLDMQDQWYASRKAPDCHCTACGGQPIDRFGVDEYDDAEPTEHNAIGVISYINNAHAVGGFTSAWPDIVRDGVAAHASLSQYVGTKVDPPANLLAWSKNLP
jgi:hypothetical protein